MEASVATREVPAEPEPSHDGAAEATRSTEELFQWSAYVHVGSGAESCAHGIDGECQDPTHFHAWVCLPNSFQIRDIVDKARAARARRARSLRDPESDAHEIMEADLEDLLLNKYDALLDALARSEVEKAVGEIVRGLQEDERFEHQAQDSEEYNRLLRIPDEELTDEQREERDTLQEDLIAYGDAVQAEVDKRTEAERERLRALKPEEVVDLERKLRIENECMEVYLHTYYTWAIYAGTRTHGMSSSRRFKRPEDLRDAAPEVTVALRNALRNLEDRTTVRGDAAGNS